MVSIILINYNTAQLTIDCINSIIDKVENLANFEIIIVDNASKIEDYNFLKSSIEIFSKFNIQLIRSRINVGFGAGNMIGVQNATGQYYTFINSDVLLVEDSITKMLNFLKITPDAALVGCQAIDENSNKYKGFDYQLSLTSELFSHSLLHRLFPKKYPSRMVTSQQPLKVGAVPGSLFTAIAKDFDEVGGFDTNVFLYYEEKDLAFRIKKQLNKNAYSLPDTTYIHLKGKSTGSSQIIRNELKIAQFYVVKKNLGALKYSIFYCINLITILIKAPFNKKNRSYLKLLLTGISVAHSMKHKQKII